MVEEELRILKSFLFQDGYTFVAIKFKHWSRYPQHILEVGISFLYSSSTGDFQQEECYFCLEENADIKKSQDIMFGGANFNFGIAQWCNLGDLKYYLRKLVRRDRLIILVHGKTDLEIVFHHLAVEVPATVLVWDTKRLGKFFHSSESLPLERILLCLNYTNLPCSLQNVGNYAHYINLAILEALVHYV